MRLFCRSKKVVQLILSVYYPKTLVTIIVGIGLVLFSYFNIKYFSWYPDIFPNPHYFIFKFILALLAYVFFAGKAMLSYAIIVDSTYILKSVYRFKPKFYVRYLKHKEYLRRKEILNSRIKKRELEAFQYLQNSKNVKIRRNDEKELLAKNIPFKPITLSNREVNKSTLPIPKTKIEQVEKPNENYIGPGPKECITYKFESKSADDDLAKIQPRKNFKKKNVILKRDWDKINLKAKSIGELGELLIFRNEKIRISKLNTSKKPVHVSMEIGDGFGYDILSFNNELNEIYLEVKSSINDNINSMRFTPNEINKMKKYWKKYIVIRVFNLNMETQSFEWESFSASEILNKFDFVPFGYIAKIK